MAQQDYGTKSRIYIVIYTTLDFRNNIWMKCTHNQLGQMTPMDAISHGLFHIAQHIGNIIRIS